VLPRCYPTRRNHPFNNPQHPALSFNIYQAFLRFLTIFPIGPILTGPDLPAQAKMEDSLPARPSSNYRVRVAPDLGGQFLVARVAPKGVFEPILVAPLWVFRFGQNILIHYFPLLASSCQFNQKNILQNYIPF
jgi:hypothetical protein